MDKISNNLEQNTRLNSVEMLRGIAALSVCLFHYALGNTNFLSDGFWVKKVFSYGYLGVDMFFIISGFVIPYSLYKVNHKYKDTKNFILKRVLRVDPPYIVTIFLIILLNYISTLSPYYKGQPYNIDFYNLILHFGYLNTLVGQPWLSPVFWTLAIEFQFYLIMALLFPLLLNKSKWISALTCLAFLGTFFIFKNPALIFNSSLFFVFGILIFYFHINFFNRYVIIVASLLLVLVIYHFNSTAVLGVCIFTYLIICYLKNWSNKLLLFLGSISYSLYLLHVSIGGRLINFSINFFEGNFIRLIILGFIVLITILISYIFYLLIERSSVKLSKKLTYTNKILQSP